MDNAHLNDGLEASNDDEPSNDDERDMLEEDDDARDMSSLHVEKETEKGDDGFLV